MEHTTLGASFHEEAIPSVFPPLTRADVLACQCSSWYPTFDRITIKTKIVKPLSAEFLEYLESDSVSIPEGSEDACVCVSNFCIIPHQLLDCRIQDPGV